MMENLEHSYADDTKLRLRVFAYYAVMLGAFIVGLYGLISLVSLASAEIQHSVHIM